jgi:Tol biopolymer transport system component
MSDTPPAVPGRAVFVSYAREDSASAHRIAEALRSGGVEVWLDQEGGLVGGDAWDRKIREQINGCALFVPIISANTQARKEGYFRLEWHLAEERVRLIAKGVPFLVPVSVDGTAERGALVPDAFLAVQWTRLPGGDAPAAFVARVRKLLGEPLPESAGAARGASGPPAEPPVSSSVAVQSANIFPAPSRATDERFETFERQPSLLQRALPIAAAVIATALIAGLVAWRLWPKPAPAPVTRFIYRLPDGQTFRSTNRRVIAISPDGQSIVYTTNRGVYLHKLDELDAHAIPGVDATRYPTLFFSPDGKSFGYLQLGQLMRVPVTGGAPLVVCTYTTPTSGNGFWARDGAIFFDSPAGILRVPETGGTPSVVIPAKEGALLSGPQLLPDGDTVLFTERPAGVTAIDGARIVAQKISTGLRKVLVESGSDATYVSPGHLAYVVGNTLMGVDFDANRLTVSGGATPLVQGLRRNLGANLDSTSYRIADNGTLIWIHAAALVGANTWQLALTDRAGKLTPLALPPGPYDTIRISPDGTHIAVGVADSKEAYVAIYDLDGKTALRRLTFGGNSRYPVWSRDGRNVTFQSDREGDLAIFWQRADGSTQPERLTKPGPDTAHVPSSWSPNDEHLLFVAIPAKEPEAYGAILTYERRSGTTASFANTVKAVQSPMFSPDGHWIAYSEEAGLFVQPFPTTGAKFQVPCLEGDNPGRHGFWSLDGTMLYFSTGPGRAAVVSFTTQPTVAFGNQATVLRPFPGASAIMPRTFDIMPDGRLLGRIAPGQVDVGTGQAEIRVVLNWTEELKRLVAVK